ncbi:MAG: autotransporter domain-containing protein, partial [Alphaproteobacteria bacterium]|nr:autotransporter domain-containing protein [Alphaproteobacteria bacterium]MBO5441910.1 autotransporter domain-containing protein [Alphaproteobacteria bacterium]
AVIEGDVDTPSLTFNFDHSLSKAITGTLGSVDKLTVAKGTLSFDKEPTNTISMVEVKSGATLDIGLNTLHSTGDKVDGEGVLFADNSTLKFTATSAEEHGKIRANYVNISENGTTLDMTFNGAALKEGESLDIQLFEQSEDEEGVEIEGKFANLKNNARYDFVDAGDGKYTVTGVKSASDVVESANGTANNVSTAEAWDNVDTSKTTNTTVVAVAERLAELSNSTNIKDKKAYVDALTAVAPEVAPMVQKTQTETTNQVFGAVSSRLTGGSVSSASQGMSSGDNVFERVAVWVQGLFNKSKLDDTKKAKGFDADTYGTAFGFEKQLDRATKAGLGYAYSKTDIDGFMRDTDVKTHTAIAYGEYKPSNWYVNGIATYGWSDYEENKNVAGVGVKADYDVETFGLQAMTGYEMNVNGLAVTPEAGLRYVHIKQDGYKDSADQRVSGNDSDILTGVIGAKLSKNYELNNGMNLKPEARVAATYDLINDDVNSVVTLANGSAYQVNGKSLDRFGMEFGVGVTAEVNDQVELSLGYEGKFREDYQDHTGLLNAKYRF